mgnify:CR=1 FL=1
MLSSVALRSAPSGSVSAHCTERIDHGVLYGMIEYAVNAASVAGTSSPAAWYREVVVPAGV